MTTSLVSSPESGTHLPGSPQWLEALRAELKTAWEESGRGKLETCEIAATIERPFSHVHFLEVGSPAGAARVVAKSTVRDPMNRPFWDRQIQATVEFEILEHLHSRFEDFPALGVPRPICVLPEFDTFVMEHVPGVALSDGHASLRRFSKSPPFKIAGADYQRLGNWLARFQEFTRPETGDAKCLNGIEERVRLRLEKIQQACDPRVPREFVPRLERRLESLLQEVAKEPIPICGRHGDFGPWNVLVGKQPGSAEDAKRRLVVIDFMGYSREPRPLDAINVLAFLQHESAGITTDPRRVRELQKRFLYGYSSQVVYSRPLLVLCELHARVYGVWDCLSSPQTRWHHRWGQNKSLRRNIAWLQAENAAGVWQDLQTRSRLSS